MSGLEDEIVRRGKRDAYIKALVEAIAPIVYQDLWENWTGENDNALWALIRATPEQRAAAFIAAVEQTS